MTASTKLARRLSSGIYGRLEFDFACNRGHAFSEAHMHGVIMEILASNVDPRVRSILPSFAIPALQSASRVGGRKREVDFAIVSRSERSDVEVCIEAKWANSSHATETKILLDVCRLALVSEANPRAVCLFVLAGGKTAIEGLLAKGVLAPHGSGTRPSRLLRYPYGDNPTSYTMKNTARSNSQLDTKMRAKVETDLPEMPEKAVSLLYKPSHDLTENWSVLVWRVASSRW